MKKGPSIFFVTLAALLAALPTAAQQGGPGSGSMGGPPMRGRFGDEGAPLPPQRPDMPLRDFLRGHQPPPEMQGMSREERRQLRRDIHEAGQDIYRRGPGHRRF